ncbi:MAG TPA: universal stress protein [Herpetosiphonaceae bacterium]
MERQILVPLDGSPGAEQALPHAIQLARATASNLHLTQVVGPVISPPSLAWPVPAPVNVQRWTEALRLEAHRYLDALALRLHAEGVKARTSVLVGDPAAEIVRLAAEEAGIRTIAMATHGSGGLTRLRFGSVAKTILPMTPVPLLLVRVKAAAQPAEAKPWIGAPRPRTILLPLDGSDCAEQALADAQQLGRRSGAALVLTAIAEPMPVLAGGGDAADEAARARHRLATYLEHVAARLQRAGSTARIHVGEGDPAAMICAAASEERADLIVMGTHGRSRFQRFLLGSVALGVSAHTDVPVLLIRAEAERGHGA